MQDFIDAYAVLGVDPHASHDAIKAAYRRLATNHHPDLASPDQRGSATERMQTVNVAYGLIGQPELRTRYDRLRLAHRARGSLDGAEDVWLALVRAAGRWVGRQANHRRGGWYRAGYAVGRWLHG